MPEPPEVFNWAHQINRWAIQDGDGSERATAALRLMPSMFAIGTPNKDHVNCTVSRNDYDDACEPSNPSYAPDIHDAAKSLKEAWQYLLKPLVPGPVQVVARGKQLAIAAGHHCIVIRFILEAHIVRFSRSDFDDIVGQSSVPGPNANKSKASKLRTFLLPERFKEPGTQNKKRTINIMAAIVSSNFVWALVDFSRLAQFHIVSRTRQFDASDLQPGSEIWDSLWAPFGSGPCWIIERPLAISALQNWRADILKQPGRARSIIWYLTQKDACAALSAFGEHTAHDLLYYMTIFPGTPADVICQDDESFASFVQGIMDYSDQWTTPKFLSLTGGISNSSNPLAFNAKSYKFYSSAYIKVFKKDRVRADARIYNKMLLAGLLDPNHIIGQPYVASAPLLKPGQTKWLNVYQRDKRYTAIRARCPDGWKDGPETPVFADVRLAGYTSGIGPADFHEVKLNMPDLAQVNHLKGTPGRKPVHHTGQRGRPRKAPTISKLKQMASTLERCKARFNNRIEKYNQELMTPSSPVKTRSDQSATKENCPTPYHLQRSNYRNFSE